MTTTTTMTTTISTTTMTTPTINNPDNNNQKQYPSLPAFQTDLKTHLIVFTLLIFVVSLNAATITVKQDGTGDFEIIQDGFDASVTGDTILVYPGIYNENIYLLHKGITLASLYLITQDEEYIRQTIVDPNYNGETALRLGYSPGCTPIIDGFTIQHGGGNEHAGKGGGIQIDDVDCSIRNCIVQNNIAKYGGGICVEDCSVVIENCIIQNNLAMVGGGVYSKINANVFFSGDYIRFNQAKIAGGGIMCAYNSNTVFDPDNRCNIYLNYSSYGSDYLKWNESSAQIIYVDTFTVINPDQHFIYSYDDYHYPVNDLTLDIQHAKIEPVNNDLYVNPVTGNDLNDGLTLQSPLKTIAYAYHIIASDSLNPHSIFLSNGIYSTTTNNEKLPLNGRSHISLIGTHPDSTILDAEFNLYFMWMYGMMENFTIKNISFVNGFGNLLSVASYYSGLKIILCNNLNIDNVKILNCTSSSNPAIYASKNDNISFSNILIEDCKGGFCFSIGNGHEPPKTFQITNCKIINNDPDSVPESGVGGGLGIVGSLVTPDLLKGSIKNIQITDNLQTPDLSWGQPGGVVALSATYFSKVDVVNATIANNISRNELSSAVKADDGAEVNIYNSILYGDSLLELTLGSFQGVDAPVTANISYSNLEGGEDAVLNWYNQNTLNWLEGNIDANPLWDTTSAIPYSLSWNSPCFDAGVPMYEFGMDYPYIKIEDETIVLYKIDGDTLHIPSVDLAGNPRIVSGRIDMGAYECQDTTTSINELINKNIHETKIEIYPNPFRYNATIIFKLKEKAKVKVIIYDIKGNQVRKLMDASLSQGSYTMIWEGVDDLAQTIKVGSYIVTIYLNGVKASSKKIIKK